MEKSAAILMQPQSVALKESVASRLFRFCSHCSSNDLFMGVPETSKEFAQQTRPDVPLNVCRGARVHCVGALSVAWPADDGPPRLAIQGATFRTSAHRSRFARHAFARPFKRSMQLHVVDEQLPADSTAKPRYDAFSICWRTLSTMVGSHSEPPPVQPSSQDLKRHSYKATRSSPSRGKSARLAFVHCWGRASAVHPATHDEFI